MSKREDIEREAAHLPPGGARPTHEELLARVAQLERSASFAERNPNPIAETDFAGRVLYLSPAAERLFPDLHQAGPAHPWLANWESVVHCLQVGSGAAHVRVVGVGGRFYLQTVHLVPETGRVYVFGTDITERKQAEDALHEREHLLSESQRIAHLGTWSWEGDRGTACWSAETYRIYGVTRTAFEPTQASFLRLIHPDDRKAMEAWIQACLAGERPGELYFRIVRPDGSIRLLVGRGELAPATGQAAPRLSGTVQDVTERRLADETGREGEVRLREIIEHAPMSMAIVGMDGTIEYINRKARTTFGYGLEDIPTMEHWWVLAYPDPSYRREVVATWTGLLGRALAEHHGIEGREYRVACKDGTVKTMLISGVPVADKVFVMFDDVTERKRAEEALRVSEERYRTVLRTAMDGFYRVDAEGRLLEVNESYVRMSGYSAQELLTMRISDLEAVEAAAETAARIQKIAERGEDRFETRHRRKDGSVFDLEASVQYRALGGGQLVVFMRDITERKRAEEALRASERKYRTLVETTNTGFVIIGPGGRVVDANSEYVRLTGHQRLGEILGRCVIEWTADFDHARNAAEVQKCFQAGRVRDLEMHYLDPQGRVTPIEINATVVPSAEGDQILALCRDITERKAAEAEREKLVEALRQSDQRKDEFLGMLSHELRNPLTPIRNGLYILDRATPGSEQAHRARVVIDRQVGHLARLVDDLLDVTRISRGKIRLQRRRVDLVDLVRATVEDHRSLLEQHEVLVDLPREAIWIDGDPTRLAQVLGNLLQNAAKFTPVGGRVSVSAAQARGRAVLEVCDTGMGIDPSTLGRLFEPFAQADRSLDRSRGGLGLGLALVKGMVALHGGEVSARSDGPGRGARFTIQLPTAVEERLAVEPGASPCEAATGGRRRVLIIEDNVDAADSLSEVLQLAGHRVAVAFNGEAGLAKAREFRPEIVLCDIGLPGAVDGYAVARALRRDPTTASVTLVALTGYAQPEDQRRARDAGFDAHLAKPPDLPALCRLLSEAPHRRSPAGAEAGPP